MRKLASISSFVFCLTMFVACVSNEPIPENEDKDGYLPQTSLLQQILVNEDTASYSTHHNFQLEDNSNDSKKEDVTKIVLHYPFIDSFLNTSVKDSINKMIQNILLQDIMGEVTYVDVKERMQEFITDYKVHKKEMRAFHLPVASSWFFELTIDILLNSPRLMSMRVYKLEFTGGAHANPWTTYINLDLKSGTQLTLDELFVGDYGAELLMVAEAQFKEATNLNQDSSLAETIFEFSSGDFMLPQNFSIGKQGISFYYNPYDLGPFALGVISFQIPYNSLMSILNKNLLKLEAVEYYELPCLK
jgi:hypothetical protein